MKNLLFLLLLCPLLTFAQADTAKVKPTETYCILTFNPGLFATRLSVDYGKKEKDYTAQQLKEAGGLSVIKSLVEGMNYMSQQGWIFVSIYVTPIDNKSNLFLQHVVYRRL